MKAWVRENYGGPEQLQLKDVEVPQVSSGDVLVRVRAIGINRAEMYFRSGAWGDVAPISGIECVGEVEHDPSGRLKKGAKVAAFMGGMGRTRNGSYAEFVAPRSQNVLPLESSLSWAQLAAIPETYSTAWACLFQALDVAEDNTIVIRGATSALGLAAINLASGEGLQIVASTRSSEQKSRLESLGAKHVLTESPHLSEDVRRLYPSGVRGVLDLVGNSTVLDSMKMLERDGTTCVAGFLGGSDPVPLDMLSGLQPGGYLTFFVSILFGEPQYSLSRIPLQAIVRDVERGRYDASPVRVFGFDELPASHVLMESNGAKGKIVVEMA
jgi:NADPH2:quinone reductase